MKSIHDAATLQELTSRINALRPDSQRQWGKMNVSQMMAHCSNALEVNLGDTPRKQNLMGKIFGKMALRAITSDKPVKRNMPTDKGFLISDERDFDKERQRLIALLTRISKADPAALAAYPHPFFGKMTPNEWDVLNYKHMDHHLRQFGV